MTLSKNIDIKKSEWNLTSQVFIDKVQEVSMFISWYSREILFEGDEKCVYTEAATGSVL